MFWRLSWIILQYAQTQLNRSAIRTDSVESFCNAHRLSWIVLQYAQTQLNRSAICTDSVTSFCNTHTAYERNVSTNTFLLHLLALCWYVTELSSVPSDIVSLKLRHFVPKNCAAGVNYSRAVNAFHSVTEFVVAEDEFLRWLLAVFHCVICICLTCRSTFHSVVWRPWLPLHQTLLLRPFVLRLFALNLWRRNYFLNFSTPCI